MRRRSSLAPPDRPAAAGDSIALDRRNLDRRRCVFCPSAQRRPVGFPEFLLTSRASSDQPWPERLALPTPGRLIGVDLVAPSFIVTTGFADASDAGERHDAWGLPRRKDA
jgi:hypothetical protein